MKWMDVVEKDRSIELEGDKTTESRQVEWFGDGGENSWRVMKKKY